MAQFSWPTRIVFGRGSLEALKGLKAQNALVVTDPYFSQNGLAGQVRALLSPAQVRVFDQVAPDPTAELVAQGVAQLTAFAPDTVVALGGGSAIDCAKAMVYFGGKPVRLAAIPTTSGTGAEVTSFAVITAQGKKFPLVEESLRPEVAILDGDLLDTLPPSLIADAGFDVLAHCLEALAAKGRSLITDALARQAFAVTLKELPGSYAGQTAHRGQIHLAATMAGVAFDGAGLGICHSLSHALGGMYHVPHGRLNAILLPAVLEYNSTRAMEQYVFLARHCELAGPTPRLSLKNLTFALTRLRRTLGLPSTLGQAGIEKLDKQTAAATALADPCTAANPVPTTQKALESILEAVK